jgi:hypothetical protein
MVTNTTSSFPDNWKDLFLLDQPLDMDAFLQSDLLAARRSFEMKRTIANMTSGSISFIASILLVTHILRSHECLSTTYHRLIFGLSAADIISSLANAPSSTMVPKEMSYLAPFASGNIVTCDAQGFLVTFAVSASVGYNCSVCFYYLAIITYNKKYAYIEKKLEPWFHGISILFPLLIGVILLATNGYNGPNGASCYPDSHNPPHCIGYETGDVPKGYSIPCGRGGEEIQTATMIIAVFWLILIAPIIILVTMVRMFRSVAKIEKRMLKYGVNALRLRTTPAAPFTSNNNSTDQKEARGFALKRFCAQFGSQTNHRSAICCFPCPCVGNNAGCDDPEEKPSRRTKSNKMASQKRAVLYMAFGYAGAWLLTWTPFFVSAVYFFIFTKSYPQDTVEILVAWMTPLQGFFNFVVFMAPKVRDTKTMAMRRKRTDSSDNNNQKQHQYLTWCQAFYKAYMDRGRRLEDRNMRNNNRTERRSNNRAAGRKLRETIRIMLGRMKSFTATLSMSSTRSPSIAETNECFESGGRPAAASSP